MLELSALLVVLAGVIYDGKACDFFIMMCLVQCLDALMWKCGIP